MNQIFIYLAVTSTAFGAGLIIGYIAGHAYGQEEKDHGIG